MLEIKEYNDKCFAVIGDTKAVKEDLKSLGGKFNGKLSCGAGWIFANDKREAVNKYISTGEVSKKEDWKAAVTAEYAKIGHPEWANDVDTAIKLESLGGYMIECKRKIKTEFSFGYSDIGQGMSYDEMREAMTAARNDEDFFFDENLEEIKDDFEKIEKHQAYIVRLYLPINGENANLWGLRWSCSSWPEDLERNFGKEGVDYFAFERLSPDDQNSIYDLLGTAAERMRDRCEKWLKRYGKEKLRFDSYWMDR
jgi:hypothetical protein